MGHLPSSIILVTIKGPWSVACAKREKLKLRKFLMEGETGIFSKNLDQRKFPTIQYIIGCEKAIWLDNARVQPYFHKPQVSEKNTA